MKHIQSCAPGIDFEGCECDCHRTPLVGEIWLDDDPRVYAKAVLITHVSKERVYYTRKVSGIKTSSNLKRFVKSFTPGSST
jgi:hypothetical protein